MSTLERALTELPAQEKRALADWLWRKAERAPSLGRAQVRELDARADAALADRNKRFPLGDAERKLRR